MGIGTYGGSSFFFLSRNRYIRSITTVHHYQRSRYCLSQHHLMTYPPTLSYCVWLVVHIHDHRLLAGMQHDQYILFFLNLMYCPSIPKVLLLIVSSIVWLALLLFYHGLLFGLFRCFHSFVPWLCCVVLCWTILTTHTVVQVRFTKLQQ